MIALAIACIAIAPDTDRITAADLGLDSAVPSTVVALAPAPGVERCFRVAELRKLAARLEVPNAPEHDVCFERRTVVLDTARLREAMQRALPAARIEILDYTRAHVPEGELEFPVAALRQSWAGAIWNGSVVYANGRRFPIRAKVMVQIPSTRVVAAEALKPGQPLTASQLRLEADEHFPTQTTAQSIEEVEGKILRSAVAAGVVIQKRWLAAAPDVVRGETVRVELYSGATVLSLEATAESSGAAGQTIALRNPVSKKRFRARIEGKGKVVVGGWIQ